MRWSFVIAACLLTLSILAQEIVVTSPVNPGQVTILASHRPRWALPQNDVGAVPPSLNLEHLAIILRRSPARQRAFEQLLKEQQTAGSAKYHRWLTPVEVGRLYGGSLHDIGAISGWLRSRGLKVDPPENTRTIISFSGPAAMVGAAFESEFHYYLIAGQKRMALRTDPQIPAALAQVIQSISGLYTINNQPYHGASAVRHAASVGGRPMGSPPGSFCGAGGCSHYIFPADFATIYDLNAVFAQGYIGTGQTIAIIGRSRVYNTDIENFEYYSGLSLVDPTVIIPPNGVDPGPPATTCCVTEDQLEATIDVTRATGAAPGATIDLVASKTSDGLDGIQIAAEYVVETNPVPAQIMNISFGACELDAGPSGVDFWNSLFSTAAAEGISVFVASGDAGAAGCDTYNSTPPATQVASPNYICSSSYDTCVGGTEFADTADPGLYWSSANSGTYESALGYIPEGGWNEPLNSSGGTQASASGGGQSSFIDKPSWQVGVGVPDGTGRFTPDIAFSSSAHDGYFACLAAAGNPCSGSDGDLGDFEYVYGTSAAAPDMAGIAALLNQALGTAQGELNQTLYALAATPANGVFHDVTIASSGVSACAVTTPSMCNNSTPSPTALTGGLGGFPVGGGYDEVTGWGSIDGYNLIVAGTALAEITTTTVTSSLNSSVFGQAVTFTATVAPEYGRSAHSPLGTVAFTSNTTAVSGCSSVAVFSSVAQCTTTTLPVGTDTIVASYSGDSSHTASSGTLSQLVNPVPSPVQFVAMTPCRVVDTRKANGPFGGPALTGGIARSFTIPSGPCTGVPVTALAYSLNVTVVPSGKLAYLTIWPTGEGQPVVSTLNSPDGRTKANAAIVPAGSQGAVSVFAADDTNLILDINGYFVSASSSTLEFFPLTPCRLVDTRKANGPLGGPILGAEAERDFKLQGTCAIPDTALAYSLNFTAIPPSGQALGYLTVWPQGDTQPVVSTLNDPTGTVVANAAIVPAGLTSGEVAVYPSSTTNLLIDVNGYFALPGTGGLQLYTVTPCRVLDTRSSGGPFDGTLEVNVVDSSCAPPSTAQAYVFNATAIPPAALGYLTLWPDGETQPVVSTLNAQDGAITSNMAIVPNNDGSIDVFGNDPTQLLLDISAYFAP
jgi:hypothetical protein